MHETFEHRADTGVRGTGKTVEEAFAECAKAMFSIMADLDRIEAKQADFLKEEADSPEQLLVNFLNQLLYLRDVKGKLYNRFELYITKHSGKWKLEGKAFGEKIEKKHSLKTDVKAATYHQAKVEEKNGKWMAQCVVDV